MTGFGAAEGPVAGGRLRIEIRTVNHRYFHLAARLPPELAALEGEVRERLRRDFERGHLAVQGRWVEPPPRTEGYLCGSPGMINSCTKVMTRNGVPSDKIFFDKFS